MRRKALLLVVLGLGGMLTLGGCATLPEDDYYDGGWDRGYRGYGGYDRERWDGPYDRDRYYRDGVRYRDGSRYRDDGRPRWRDGDRRDGGRGERDGDRRWDGDRNDGSSGRNRGERQGDWESKRRWDNQQPRYGQPGQPPRQARPVEPVRPTQPDQPLRPVDSGRPDVMRPVPGRPRIVEPWEPGSNDRYLNNPEQ